MCLGFCSQFTQNLLQRFHSINSQDLARFGLLILNKGNWDGKQVVSDKWIQEATRPSMHGPDYGYLVAEHETEAVAEWSGVELRRHRQWR
jgi:CubicO group peptidase (beta-lactamase class C family)